MPPVARAIAQAGQHGAQAVAGSATQGAVPADQSARLAEREQKIDLMRRADAAARSADPRVQQVIVSLVAAHDTILVMDNSGQISGDVRPLVRMNVRSSSNRMATRTGAGGGARQAPTSSWSTTAPRLRAEAVRQALIGSRCGRRLAGMLPVVLGPGWPGVLLHEAVGHGLEGDFNRKDLGLSAAGRTGRLATVHRGR